MIKKKISNKGVTLSELALGVAILSISAMALVAGSRMVAKIQRQILLASIHREVQTELYAISKSVRNAQKLEVISYDTLRLKVFNTKQGYDTAIVPNFFMPANLGTVTFQYIVTPEGGYLKRTDTFNGISKDRILLKNILVPATLAEPIFTALSVEPYDAVQIVFRCNQGFFKTDPRLFEITAFMKTRE